MANVRDKQSRKDKKVPMFFFGSKLPRFNLNFGSSKSQKKEIPEKPPPEKQELKKSELLSPKNEVFEKMSKASPNFSTRSSKFSSNSPEIAKLRKNLLNAQEKHRIESFSVTTSKIPILRAKIRDSSNVSSGKKFESEKADLASSSSTYFVRAQIEAKSPKIQSAKSISENPKMNFILTPGKNVLNSTPAENFFRPISRDIEKSPKLFETTAAPKPVPTMNTHDFLAAFLAEKGTSRPVVQRGLVRERAKAFEQKIEEIKVEVQLTPRCRSREPVVSLYHQHTPDKRLLVPRPTSFAYVPKLLGAVSADAQPKFVGLGPSPSMISGSGAWSSWSPSTPSSTSISTNNALPKGSSSTQSQATTSNATDNRKIPESNFLGTWSKSRGMQNLHHRTAAPSGAQMSKLGSGRLAPSPGTPASHHSFVPHSFSSGSGTWSSWSASTPASSTSISGAPQFSPSGLTESSPNNITDSSHTNISSQKFVPIDNKMVWSWPNAMSQEKLPSQVMLNSESNKKKIPSTMTSSTTSSEESKSSKTNSSPTSDGENKVCDYFDDDYKDQPDLTINSIHDTSECPIATGGGESDGRELCHDIFEEDEEPQQRKDSSLTGSIESLELDNDAANAATDINKNNKKTEDNTSICKSISPKELMRPQVMPISSWKKQNERLLPATLDDRNRSLPTMYLIQDIASIKSYLQKLRKILQEGEDGNLINQDNGSLTSAKLTLVQSEEEINDLKKQILLLKQQNNEKDRQIDALKKKLAISQSNIGQKATQTEVIISSQLFHSESAINSSGESSSNSSPVRPE